MPEAEDPMGRLPLRYRVQVGDGEDAILPDLDDLYGRMKIDPGDLDGELVEHGGLYAWWSVLAAEAEFEADRAERRLNLIEAQVTSRLKKEGEAATNIAKLVKGDDEYAEAADYYDARKRDAAILRGQMRAMDHRKEMLTLLCYRQRREYDAARDSI